MKSTLIKLLCVTALSLTPALVFAGGTNSENGATTGYKNDPDRGTEQGDMGKGVGTNGNSTSHEQISDSDLDNKVETALKNDAQLQKLDIDVEAENGVVKLSGNVSDVRWKGRATKVASSVKGVKSVQNNLSIKK
jgi:hyperosmotically inducible periplasmic protein